VEGRFEPAGLFPFNNETLWKLSLICAFMVRRMAVCTKTCGGPRALVPSWG
jgi:hypothetical protein